MALLGAFMCMTPFVTLMSSKTFEITNNKVTLNPFKVSKDCYACNKVVGEKKRPLKYNEHDDFVSNISSFL